jgi:hypothetical protein
VLDKNFSQLIVFHQGDPDFPRVGIDDDFRRHGHLGVKKQTILLKRFDRLYHDAAFPG